MADYIDRQAVNDALDKTCDIVCQYSKKQRYAMCGACPLGSAYDVIENVPTADVQPVRHEHWGSKNECSGCGCQPWYERDIRFLHYCPNCGARMDGEKNG